MNVRWAKITSWHILRAPILGLGTYRTLCGRFADGPVVDAPPGGERTCESCLRAYARRTDQ